jgi:hypothetical protein
MNVNKVSTKNYDRILNWAIYENKANFNPKQIQTNPISEAKKGAVHGNPILKGSTIMIKGACNGDYKYNDDPQEVFTEWHCGNGGIWSTIDSTVLGI